MVFALISPKLYYEFPVISFYISNLTSQSYFRGSPFFSVYVTFHSRIFGEHAQCHYVILAKTHYFVPWYRRGRPNCAESSGAVHSVFLIDVYLDLENPGGSGFWVGENRRVAEGNKEGHFTSIREQRWTDPDTKGGFQVSRSGEQGEQGEQGADLVHKSEPCLVYVCNE